MMHPLEGDTVANEATILEAVQRLVAAAKPRRVILFGSHARGEARPDSDLDFLIVERDAPDTIAEMVRLRRALRGLNVAVDVIVVSEEDVAAWGDLPGSPLYEPLREGKVLHEAAD
jgi:predicted nucleotidyltransferase